MTSEKVIGGVYSVITYLDDKGYATEKEVATKCVIQEFDKDENMIMETFGLCESI